MFTRTPPRPRHDLHRLQRIYNKGDHRKALRLALQALRDLPDHPDLHALAGSCARHIGDTRRAIKFYREAIARSGIGSDYPVHLGNILNDTGAFAAALTEFQAVLDLRPDHGPALHGLGVALLGLARPQDALPPLMGAVAGNPAEARYLHALGRAFEGAGEHEKAAECHATTVLLDGARPEYHLAHARMLHLVGQSDAALDVLNKARRRWPKDCQILNLTSVVLSVLGQMSKASTLAREALELQPNNYAGLMNFTHLHDMTREDKLVRDMHQKLAQVTQGKDEMHLRFALTKVCEDQGSYQDAYDHLVRANSLRKALLRYDPTLDHRFFEEIKHRFGRAAAALKDAGPSGPVPIFIVGMPRSGTSLVEAILARHPEVVPCGELETLSSIVRRDHTLAVPTGPAAESLQNAYLARLPKAAQTAAFVTDKMPLNFKLIGYIAC